MALMAVSAIALCSLWAGSGDIALPEPETDGKTSLERAVAERRSVRDFTSERLSREQVSQLLWAAQGITDKRGLRAAPSAGALYPLEVFVLDEDGCFLYLPKTHSLKRVKKGDLRGKLAGAALGQPYVKKAPVDIVIVAALERLDVKYGDRSERYALLEAGHAGQNILLQAAALGLGGVPIGAFSDDAVAKLLSLPKGWHPYYIIPVGHPQAPL